MMIRSCVATVFAVVAYGQLADNVNTGSSTRCNNYIAIGSASLYPVGTCYTENNALEDVDTSNTPYVGFDTQNMMYKCEETGNGTLEACQYRMGANCEGEVYKTGLCYDCNGADDQCECEIGGDASECQVFEGTVYETNLDEDFQWYCNRERAVLTRKVVNMCIQGSSEVGSQGGLSTYNFACGGYAPRSGISGAMYEYNHGEYHTTADCSGDINVPTWAPTDTTNSPSSLPTVFNQGRGYPYCTKSICDGFESQPADFTEEEPTIIEKGIDWLKDLYDSLFKFPKNKMQISSMQYNLEKRIESNMEKLEI